MDDFKGKFCNNGSFPVIRAVSDCFKKKRYQITTLTTPPTVTTKPKRDDDSLLLSKDILTTDIMDALDSPIYDNDVHDRKESKPSNSSPRAVSVGLLLTIFSLALDHSLTTAFW